MPAENWVQASQVETARSALSDLRVRRASARSEAHCSLADLAAAVLLLEVQQIALLPAAVRAVPVVLQVAQAAEWVALVEQSVQARRVAPQRVEQAALVVIVALQVAQVA